jgi:ketosteroid isomerase-like protein
MQGVGVGTNEELMAAWLDRLAIHDLVRRYSDSVTRGDWDETAKVFAADAVWECPMMQLRFDGAQAYLEFLRSSFTEQSVLIQTAHDTVIDLRGRDAANATTTVHELVRDEAGGSVNIAQYGIYFDELARFGEEWRFTHRVFVPLYMETDGVPGTVASARPVLRPNG